MIGAATGLAQFCRSIGATLGAAILGTVMQATYLHGLQKSASLMNVLPPDLAKIVDNPARFVQMKTELMAHYASPSTGDIYHLDQLYATVASALGGAVHLTFFLGALTILVALAATFLIKERPLRSE
jgi:hypothetical protein